jgi:hypothetical protein
MLKPFLILAGTVSLFLGIIGIFVPGLPSTPFILLTAGLYVRSSPALYNKLANNRITGQILKSPSNEIKVRARNMAISIMWLMIIFTSVFVFENIAAVIILIVAGIAGTIFKLKYFRRQKDKE